LTQTRIRLLHIDDHLLFVQGVYSLLLDEDAVQWMGSASTVEEGIKLCGIEKPDIVLLDYFLPDGTGLVATQKILAQNPTTRILMLTMEDSLAVMEQCKDAGVLGFLPKSIGRDELIKALLAASKGESTFPKLRETKPLTRPVSTKLDLLSRREKEIAYLVAQGLSSTEIAKKLFLSLLTVNTHRRNMLGKLDIKNIAQLALLINGNAN
jgi:DNA-binding NarL/FixJ family response regulator